MELYSFLCSFISLSKITEIPGVFISSPIASSFPESITVFMVYLHIFSGEGIKKKKKKREKEEENTQRQIYKSQLLAVVGSESEGRLMYVWTQ